MHLLLQIIHIELHSVANWGLDSY